MEKKLEEGMVMEKEGLEVEQQVVSPEEQQEDPKEEQQEEKVENPWDEEMFKKLVQTPEGKKEIQRAMDRNFTKGLETWKENNLDALVEVEFQKKFPTDPNLQRIQQLEAELNMGKAQQAVSTTLVKAGLSIEFADFFVSTNLQESQRMADLLVKMFDQEKQVYVKKYLKSIGATPKYEGQSNPKGMTREEFLNLDYTRRAELYTNDPATYSRLLKG